MGLKFFAALPLLMSSALCLASNTLQSQADSMFNGLVNTTAPQAFKGQTMDTYTGGSLFVRVPSKNYQILSIQAPYIRAGDACGSIDAFGGAFSHISSAQFKDMLKNVTSALPGVIFELAIKSVQPLLADAMQWFQTEADKFNIADQNSCQLAQKLVSSATSTLGLSTASACESIAVSLGISSDYAAAKDKCSSSSSVQSVLSSGASNPTTASQVPFTGNLVWALLKKESQLDDDEREIIMSITGTTIYPEAVDGNSEPVPVPPTSLDAETLLRGDAGSTNGSSDTVTILSCGSDTANCLNPRPVVQSFTPFDQRVRNLMQQLADDIQNRVTPGNGVITFVDNVPLPVYRMLAVAGAIQDGGDISAALRDQYNDYVAIEFAYALLNRAARDAMSVSIMGSQLSPPQERQLNKHVALVGAFLLQLDAERQTLSVKASVASQVIGQIAELQRDLKASMPQQVRDMLAYSFNN